MASKKNIAVSQVGKALAEYLGAIPGIRAAEEQVQRVKGAVSQAAFALCEAAGIVCGASTYANCTASTQPEFKAWWTSLSNGDKIAFVGRANAGSGWTNANRQAPLKGVEAIIRQVSKMKAEDLTALETAIAARKLALEEKAAEKVVKAAEKKAEAKAKAPAAAPAAGVTAEAMEVMLRKMLAGMGVAVAAK